MWGHFLQDTPPALASASSPAKGGLAALLLSPCPRGRGWLPAHPQPSWVLRWLEAPAQYCPQGEQTWSTTGTHHGTGKGPRANGAGPFSHLQPPSGPHSLKCSCLFEHTLPPRQNTLLNWETFTAGGRKTIRGSERYGDKECSINTHLSERKLSHHLRTRNNLAVSAKESVSEIKPFEHTTLK